MERGLVYWLPNPPDGTQVCGGFDGSSVDDATAIRLETFGGLQFTPRYGPSERPTIWLPAEWGGTVPRSEVHAAWDEISRRYKLHRVFCDPPQWETEIETWDSKYGDEVFVEFATYRRQMHSALDRFVTDLGTGAVKHDGCPVTELHVNNARKLARPNETYHLGKPAQHQKIDAAVTSVLAHEAASVARKSGWTDEPPPTRKVVHFRR